MGRLDRFPQAGSATGVMPLLDFAEIRRFLFDVLQSCEPGTWYSTASLISYLKAKHRYFLIPEEIPKPPPSRYTRQVKRGGKLVIEDPYPPSTPSRYGNFYEDHYTRKAIPDDAPDGFERVEGATLSAF